jgi:hypothetical protein
MSLKCRLPMPQASTMWVSEPQWIHGVWVSEFKGWWSEGVTKFNIDWWAKGECDYCFCFSYKYVVILVHEIILEKWEDVFTISKSYCDSHMITSTFILSFNFRKC